MPRPRAIRIGNIHRRVLICGWYGAGVLLLVMLIAGWSRGKRQEASVAALLAVAEDASIQAQYSPYRYELPTGMNEPVAPGTLRLITRGGQRAYRFSVVDDPPRYLEWLIQMLGDHFLARVTDIHVNDERFSDADVELLLAFPDLREVDLSYSAITDRGLARLVSQGQLVELDVSGTKVSAAALRLLANCKELKELAISDTNADEHVKAELRQALPDCLIFD